MGRMTGEAGQSADKPPGGRRTIHIVLAILVVAILPVLLMDTLVGHIGADGLRSDWLHR